MPGRCRQLLTVAAVVVVVTATTIGTVAGTADRGVAASSTTRRARSAPDPILLVHGYNGSPANWNTVRDRLLADGYRDRDVVAVAYDSTASNVTTAAQIKTAVHDLVARTGAKRVDIVSHSMGAISTRYYVQQLGGDAHVDAWVSLAGANQGTYWAYTCTADVSCQDMIPGSPVLTALTDAVPSDGRVRFATWWSPCDMVILPTTSATLVGARNTETACMGHGDVLADPTVSAEVERFVRARHRTT